MHVVECPQCKAYLSMDRPLMRQRIQCASCGAAFVATTRWMEPSDVPAGSGQAGPVRPHMYHRPPKKRMPMWMAGVAAGGAAAVILTIVLLWYFGSTVYVEIRNPDGEVVFSGRVSPQEAQRIREELRRKSRQQQKEAITEAQEQATGGEYPSEGPGRAPDLMSGPEAAGPEARAAAATVVMGPESDPKIDVSLTHVPLEGGYGGLVTGLARNGYDVPLDRLEIALYAADGSGRRMAALPGAAARYVPPRTSVPFSVEYSSIASVQIARIVAVASATKAAGDEVCWAVDPAECRTDVAGSVIRLTGKTRNRSGESVKDVKVYCDFLTGGGVVAGSATGGLDSGLTSIPAGREAFFTVEFDAAQTPYLPQVIEGFYPRVIARKF